jgi:lipoprotein-anchoring transpeptidase ErfK/SrfK
VIGSYISISVSEQQLALIEEGQVLHQYPVSTAKNGVGEKKNSGQTPRGEHIVRAKIGDGLPLNSVFVARRPTGEIYSPALADQYPERDWILTRILWLSGCELGKNRLGDCDTMQRYVYIHGTPDTEPMGQPLSHGCIRMRNTDLVELFDLISPGINVLISE